MEMHEGKATQNCAALPALEDFLLDHPWFVPISMTDGLEQLSHLGATLPPPHAAVIAASLLPIVALGRLYGFTNREEGRRKEK